VRSHLSKPLRRVMSSNLAGTRESSDMFTASMPPSTSASIYNTHTPTHMFTASMPPPPTGASVYVCVCMCVCVYVRACVGV
jgi:hypothetical protein